MVSTAATILCSYSTFYSLSGSLVGGMPRYLL
jgi:hypothetical protein